MKIMKNLLKTIQAKGLCFTKSPHQIIPNRPFENEYNENENSIKYCVRIQNHLHNLIWTECWDDFQNPKKIIYI